MEGICHRKITKIWRKVNVMTKKSSDTYIRHGEYTKKQSDEAHIDMQQILKFSVKRN